ncbi:D-2-hydroxyacid dehydrogenase [Lederbergia wuyishanensis]|uniref:Phosphoglycerate dehydrogenase-like enzyme n=1 Tax=Lederbergia wuyishanensis TaxID=1347903 RepID=A0ABU0D2B1_9BACI|nr:D-2-hydroxyacid dehydrogenase [Lederbergia wuyishanensis]MCJ8007287.1 D-2-hydroxyacid dehydrogenase [Lederbergia wuyishanensis]MDQ0342557.1 phosphoglycerate dehydrogenase-like enzyme [Lederbergia wuyishanensis]
MEISKIVVTGRIYKEIQEVIDGLETDKIFRFLPEESVCQEDIDWADAYIAFKPIPNMDYKNIKWIHSLGAGVDSFLFDRVWNDKILITRTNCSFGERISQYSLSYVLSDLQLHENFQKNQLNKQWSQKTPELLREKNVLIFGTGKIGSEVARTFNYFRANVFGVSLSGFPKEPFKEVFVTNKIHSISSNMDIVINTLPLTDKTYELFDFDMFNKFNSILFINCGRGASIEDKAVIKALDSGHIRKAILDVFLEEPLSGKNILWNRKDITITPHISAITTPAEAVTCFMETMNNIEANVELENKVNIVKGY